MGPDATRYLIAGRGEPVARPFHLRWFLPWLAGDSIERWRAVWLASWPLLAAGMTFLGWQTTGSWWRGAASAVFVCGLPGVWGPSVVRPVGVDLPAMALTVAGVVGIHLGGVAVLPGIVLVCVAAAVKESSPVWAACLAWSPLPLLAFVVPLATAMVRKPGMDPVSDKYRNVTDHPFRTGLAFHQDQWRDAWLMVAPWGACLAALYQPSWQVGVVIVLAYAQLLVATDTVRLYQTAAGPTLALAAATVIPLPWLALVVALHICWWRPERIVMQRG